MNRELIELSLPVPLLVHLSKTAEEKAMPLTELIEIVLETFSVFLEERAARGETATITHIVKGAA